MTLSKYILAVAGLILMLLATGFAAAQTPADAAAGKNVSAETTFAKEAEWFSYRDAYKTMLRFEKYGKPKNLIQNHFQISPKDNSATMEAVRLTLVSKSSRLYLPLDATGRTVLPLLKAAYDENSELILNQKPNQKSNQYQFRPRVSIVIRADGVYEAADLRAACEQQMAYQTYLGGEVSRGKKCIGVRFVYAKKSPDAVVELKSADRATLSLPSADGPAFWDESNENFKTLTYLFASAPEKAQLITRSAPLAISAQFN